MATEHPMNYIQAKINNLNNYYGLDLCIELSGVPRRPRILTKGGAIVSPSLPRDMMYEWVCAYEKGIDLGWKLCMNRE